MKIELSEGKYTLVFNETTGELNALRYGKEWRNLNGDGLVLSLGQRIEQLTSDLAAAQCEVKEYADRAYELNCALTLKSAELAALAREEKL